MTFNQKDIVLSLFDEKYPNPANAILPKSRESNSERYGGKSTKTPIKCVPTYLYFIQNVVSGSIKIGYTSDLDARLSDHQVGSDAPLKYILTIPFSDDLKAKDMEKELHLKFSKYNIRGEWFEPAEEILNLVDLVGGEVQVRVPTTKKINRDGRYWGCGHKRKDWQSKCTKCLLKL
jgi:predicted GIY-YIG superfamily endonuclease